MKARQIWVSCILVALIVSENLFLYYFFNKGLLTTGKNAWGLFLSSVFIGIILIYKFFDKELYIPADSSKTKYVSIGLFALALVALGVWSDHITSASELNPFHSDVIPMVVHQCKQFLKGLSPYAPIDFFGYPEYPNNLPMKWLPYAIAEGAKIDYRLISYVFWALVAIWLFTRVVVSGSGAKACVAGALLLASQWVLLHYSPDFASQSLEVLIAAYYMLLVLALNTRSYVFHAIAIACCLMSRYSLVLWLPLYAFALFISGQRKLVYGAAAGSAILCAVFVILFLSGHFNVLKESYTNYDIVTQYEWKNNLNGAGKPLQVFNGVGMAYLIVARFSQYGIVQQIHMVQVIQYVSIFLTILILAAWFARNKRRIDTRIFLVASFKIYLAVFLFTLKLPYSYLMCVGNFVSIALFCEQLRYKISGKAAHGPMQAIPVK